MIEPPAPFSSMSTTALVALAYGLDAYLDGGFTEGSADYVELIDADALAGAQAEIGHGELAPLLDEIAFTLQGRHAQMAGSLAAWHAWNYRSISWGQALLDGASAVEEDAAAAAA